MILINNDALIEDEQDLEDFIKILEGESYNELSKQVCQVISDFLFDVWERDDKLTKMIHKKISRSLYPVELIDLSETGDWTGIAIRAISKNKAYREKKIDIKTFNGLCDTYFKGMKPLYNRLIEIEGIDKGV